MNGLSDFPAFTQAIGVVAVYALLKEAIPRLLSRNGNGKVMTVSQHDKECGLKLDPIKEQVKTLHNDFRFYMKSQGITPPSDGG